jgi:hypothetical protein
MAVPAHMTCSTPVSSCLPRLLRILLEHDSVILCLQANVSFVPVAPSAVLGNPAISGKDKCRHCLQRRYRMFGSSANLLLSWCSCCLAYTQQAATAPNACMPCHGTASVHCCIAKVPFFLTYYSMLTATMHCCCSLSLHVLPPDMFFTTKECLRNDKSTCFPVGNQYYDITHSGLGAMVRPVPLPCCASGVCHQADLLW